MFVEVNDRIVQVDEIKQIKPVGDGRFRVFISDDYDYEDVTLEDAQRIKAILLAEKPRGAFPPKIPDPVPVTDSRVRFG